MTFTHPELSIQASQYIVVLMIVGTLLWAVIRKSLTPILLSIVLVAGGVGGTVEEDPSALIGGKATWCAPTPTHCQNWGGDAMLGAMPSFDFGDEPFVATVCSGGRCVDVTVVSYCACGERNGVPTVIDLSPAAFRQLAPLSRGVIDVEVTIGGSPGPAMTLPPTFTEDDY